MLIRTQSHLNVVRGGRRELFHEPWRSVPGAAGAELTTSIPIPERIISIEDSISDVIFTACVTKVVIPHKWRYWSMLTVAYVCTRAYILPERVVLVNCCSKCPNMFPRPAMCYADSINIIGINCCLTTTVVRAKSIWSLLWYPMIFPHTREYCTPCTWSTVEEHPGLSVFIAHSG